MRHLSKLILFLTAVLVFGCFSAPAATVFRQPRNLREIGDSAFEGVHMPEKYSTFMESRKSSG